MPATFSQSPARLAATRSRSTCGPMNRSASLPAEAQRASAWWTRSSTGIPVDRESPRNVGMGSTSRESATLRRKLACGSGSDTLRPYPVPSAAVRLVLASTSPRRAALLRAAGYDFAIRPSGTEEWPYPGGDPAGYAEALARAKAAGDGRDGGDVVVGADTVVVLDGTVFGKPADAEDATGMLRRLSGRTHEVVTAVAVRHAGTLRSGHARTRLTLRPLTDAEIRAYVDTGEPLDKAGAYGYQGEAARFVTRVEGETDTVIGLPITLVDTLLPAELRRPRAGQL